MEELQIKAIPSKIKWSYIIFTSLVSVLLTASIAVLICKRTSADLQSNAELQPTALPTVNPTVEPTVSVEDGYVNKEFKLEFNTAIGTDNAVVSLDIPKSFNYDVLEADDSNPDSYVVNCSTVRITNTDETAYMEIQPICEGWSAKYTLLPESVDLVEQKDAIANDGQFIRRIYRVPFIGPKVSYRTLDSYTKDQIEENKLIDALLIQYPYEEQYKDDFFFVSLYVNVIFNEENVSEVSREMYVHFDNIVKSMYLK